TSRAEVRRRSPHRRASRRPGRYRTGPAASWPASEEGPCGGAGNVSEFGSQGFAPSQPAAHARLVAEIAVAELAREMGFLAGDYAVADDEIERDQREQQPQAVERDGEPDQPQHHAEIDRVAREAVGAAGDDRRRRLVGLDLRAAPADRDDRPD